MTRPASFALLATLALAPAASAAAPTLDQVAADPLWMGAFPESPYWADDSVSVYFSRKEPGCEAKALIQLVLPDGVERLVNDDEWGAVDVDGGAIDAARERKAWVRNGDLFVKELGSGQRRQLTRTAAAESSPQWLLDGRLAFRRGGRFLARDLDGGLEEELVELRFEDEPGGDEKRGDLARRNRRLLEHVRDTQDRREARRTRRDERRSADPTRSSAPWYLGEKDESKGAALSPTGATLLLRVARAKRDKGRRDLMPVWISEDGFVGEKSVRAKVGTIERPAERLLLLDLERGERIDVDLSGLPGRSDDPLRELRRAGRLREAAQEPATSRKKRKEREAEPRALNVLSMKWADDGARAFVMLRSHDNKDRWIVVIDAGDGSATSVHHLHDPAWINWSFNEAGWLPGGRRLWFLSEESGRSALYLHDLDSRRTRRLTHHREVVSQVRVSRDGSRFFYCATPHHPGIRQVFALDVESGRVDQLTHLGGLNEFVLSPDEQQLLVRHSEAMRPPELWIQDAVADAVARPLTDSRSAAFLATALTAPRHVTVPSSHGAGRIHARLYTPQGPPPPGGYPAVVFIHGAGYLQNAHQGWSSYEREFLFHSLLVERGFVVLDMDWRGSAGYGRAWRTAIYRDMGRPELEDIRDGVNWLVKEARVARERVGCYGGSYGGFLTFMALFRQPDLFAAGAALRPVTDWAHYNHAYTSNILNTPELDPEAYRRSSPIEFAEGLSKPLLICAPMVDDNVLFLDTVRLVQRLIELGKTEHFETALYPAEGHGFKEPSSWRDEYARILALFEAQLR